MGLSIKQRLVRYHIDQRDKLQRHLNSGSPADERARIKKEHTFHAEAVEFISQGGLLGS